MRKDNDRQAWDNVISRKQCIASSIVARFLVTFVLLTFLTTAGATEFADTLCLGVKFSQGERVSDLSMLTELGVKWARERIVWSQFEPRRNHYSYFEPVFQHELNFYRAHDIAVIAVLTLKNAAAYSINANGATPDEAYDPEAFGRFALAVAQALERQGVKFVLEIGNEPHNSELGKVFGGSWNGAPPSPWLHHYIAMVNAAVAAVKKWNPAVRVLAQDDMWIVHYHFLDAGLTPGIDGLSVHPYVNGIPERAAVASDTDWTRPYQVVDKDRSFASAPRRLRDYAESKLGHQPEIWITEWGWPTQEIAPSFSALQVAQYLPRAFILAAEAKVVATCWFSSQDSVDGPMGLTLNNGERRPAYNAFRVLSDQLGALTFDGRIFQSADQIEGVNVFQFRGRGDDGRIVAWNSGAHPGALRLKGKGQAISFDGLTINPRLIGVSGQSCLDLGPGAIYLAGDWSDSRNVAAVTKGGCDEMERRF